MKMTKTKQLMIDIAYFIAAGFILGIGFMGASHIIGAPDGHILICMATDLDTKAVCKPLKDYIEKSQEIHAKNSAHSDQ